MAIATLIAGALMAQAAAAPSLEATVTAPQIEQVDVGYADLMAGRPADAIARIRDNRELDASDPAALINLGTAYARLGRMNKAQDAYRSAIASSTRYDLQLADGRWMDSRQAARLASRSLTTGQMLAVR
ncbi:MAG: tetratricopeptide repeat protein [Novosphingobium sp.]